MLEKFKVLLLLGITATMLFMAGKPAAKFGGSYADSLFTSATNTAATLSTTSAVVLAKNSGRTYAIFTNDDASIVEYLALGGTATVNSGIRLAPGGSYTINASNLYIGDVSALSASSTPKLTITYH